MPHLPLVADHLDGAVCVFDNRLGNAAEHEPLQPRPTMGADDDEIGPPFVGGIDNFRTWVSFANRRFDRECGSGDALTSGLRESFGFFDLARPDIVERGRRKHDFRGGWRVRLNDGENPYGTGARPRAAANLVDRVVRRRRPVDCQQNFHANLTVAWRSTNVARLSVHQERVPASAIPDTLSRVPEPRTFRCAEGELSAGLAASGRDSARTPSFCRGVAQNTSTFHAAAQARAFALLSGERDTGAGVTTYIQTFK